MGNELLYLESMGRCIYIKSLSSKDSDLYLVRIDVNGVFHLEGGIGEERTNFNVTDDARLVLV